MGTYLKYAFYYINTYIFILISKTCNIMHLTLKCNYYLLSK